MSGKTNLSSASDLSSTSGSVKTVAFLISSNTSAAPNVIESRASSTFIDKDKSNFKVSRTLTENATKNVSIIADGLSKQTTEETYASGSIFQGKSLNYCFII